MIRHSMLLSSLALTSIFALTAAGDPSIDVAKSSVIATFTQEKVPVDTPFKRFSGHIQYSAAQPAAARADLEVLTGSIDLGSDDYNAEVRKKSWLDSATYPKATFVSTAIRPGGNGGFTTTGTLTLKGKSVTLNVPVKVSRVGTATAFDGAFEISRAYFGIGDPEWNDVLDDKVKVRFHLVE